VESIDFGDKGHQMIKSLSINIVIFIEFHAQQQQKSELTLKNR